MREAFIQNVVFRDTSRALNHVKEKKKILLKNKFNIRTILNIFFDNIILKRQSIDISLNETMTYLT